MRWLKDAPLLAKAALCLLPFNIVWAVTYLDYYNLDALDINYASGVVTKISPISKTAWLFITVSGDSGSFELIVTPSAAEREAILSLRNEEEVRFGYDPRLEWSAGSILAGTAPALLYLQREREAHPIISIGMDGLKHRVGRARLRCLIALVNLLVVAIWFGVLFVRRRDRNGV